MVFRLKKSLGRPLAQRVDLLDGWDLETLPSQSLHFSHCCHHFLAGQKVALGRLCSLLRVGNTAANPPPTLFISRDRGAVVTEFGLNPFLLL